jgi:hypothetical protein
MLCQWVRRPRQNDRRRGALQASSCHPATRPGHRCPRRVAGAGLTLTNVPRIPCGEHRMLRQLTDTTDRVKHQAEPAEVHLYLLCGAREYAAPDPPAARLPLAAAVCTSDWFRIIAARAGRCFFLRSSRGRRNRWQWKDRWRRGQPAWLTGCRPWDTRRLRGRR